jgi:hypothetical protein
MAKLRTAPGMREKAPDVWELVVEAGRDVVTGRRRQVSRVFRGSLRDAKKGRAELLVEVGKGRHTGSRATVEGLFSEWILELERKGRSPNTIRGYQNNYRRNIAPTLGSVPVTKVTMKMLTDLYGAHQRRGLSPRSVYQIHGAARRCSPRPAGGGGGRRTLHSGPSRRRSPTPSPPSRGLTTFAH